MHILFLHGGSWFDAKGGSEKQLELIKSACSKQGHRIAHVSFSSINHDLPSCMQMPYGKLYSIKSSYSYPRRMYMLYRIVTATRPDLIYTRSFRCIYLAYLIKRLLGIPAVYNISSTLHCIPLAQRKKISSQFLFRRLSSLALLQSVAHSLLPRLDMIVAQTGYQRELLRKNFSVDSIVIPNGHVVSLEQVIPEALPPIVTWISNIKKWKRPELFIELARRCESSEARFIMCGRPNTGAYQEGIERLVRDTPNLSYLGEISFEDVDSLIAESAMFVNTSEELEGFPNTFIQAWMQRTPVVTLTYDPDDIIEEQRIGAHSRTFDCMVHDVLALIDDENTRKQMGKRAREYAVENHDISKNISRYLELFRSLIE